MFCYGIYIPLIVNLKKVFEKEIKMKNTLESGRSMIEMLGVLAIVGVLTVGAISGYTNAMERFKKTKALEEVNYIVSEMRERGISNGSYTEVLTDSPSDELVTAALGTKTVNNPWKGSYTVFSSSASSDAAGGTLTAGAMFGIVISGLPAGCAGLRSTNFNGSVDYQGTANGKGDCVIAAPSDGSWITNNQASSNSTGGSVFLIRFK